jgi:hypothetical protein
MMKDGEVPLVIEVRGRKFRLTEFHDVRELRLDFVQGSLRGIHTFDLDGNYWAPGATKEKDFGSMPWGMEEIE